MVGKAVMHDKENADLGNRIGDRLRILYQRRKLSGPVTELFEDPAAMTTAGQSAHIDVDTPLARSSMNLQRIFEPAPSKQHRKVNAFGTVCMTVIRAVRRRNYSSPRHAVATVCASSRAKVFQRHPRSEMAAQHKHDISLQTDRVAQFRCNQDTPGPSI